MIRVYNKEKECWVTDNVYLSASPDCLMYTLKKGWFGRNKLVPLPPEMYIYHRDIGLLDKNDVLIYEGDIVRCEVAEGRIIEGLVAYAHELSAYVVLVSETSEFYSLGDNICDYVEVIGNVFDEKEDGVIDE